MKPLPVLVERAAAWQSEHPLTADCPAGGENPQGFHPFAKPSPILAEESAAGRQNTVMRSAPAGSENPQGFHPFAKPLPVLVEGTAAWQAEYRHVAAVRAIAWQALRARNAAA
ncbi:MAG: hypothetical protein LBK61_03220 [Spirochaetaceae bacterium]|nr:hypothetical protein [Spirochaetaceae bacterium]